MAVDLNTFVAYCEEVIDEGKLQADYLRKVLRDSALESHAANTNLIYTYKGGPQTIGPT